MSKARTLANLISDNAELADGQISVAEVVGAAPTASPTFTGNIDAGDNVKIRLGDSDDLQIYHTGGQSLIDDVGTGQLTIRSNGTDIRLADSSNNRMLIAKVGAEVELYHNNSPKLATTSAGIAVTGTSALGGDTTVTGTLAVSRPSSGYGAVEVGGSSGGLIDLKAPFSDDYDARIIYNNDVDLQIITLAADEPILLRQGNSTRLSTTTTGIDVTGNLDVSSAASTVLNVEATGANDSRVRITAGNANTSYIEFADPDDVDTGEIRYTHATNVMQFRTAGNVLAMTIDSSQNVGIGTTVPSEKLTVSAGAGDGIFLEDSSGSGSSPFIKARGKRSDGNGSQSFGGKLLLDGHRTDVAVASGKSLGTVAFGGNHTNGTAANILYSASISGVSEGTFSNATTMPTALVFYTGSTGRADNTANVTSGDEAMRIDSNGNVGISQPNPAALLHIGDSSNSLGTTLGDSLSNLTLHSDTANTDSLVFTTRRTADGSDWTTAAHRIQRKVDATIQGYMEFGNHVNSLITFGKGGNEYIRIDGAGSLLVGKTALSTGTVGCELRANGKLVGVMDGGNHTLGRLTSNGDIVKFAKDDTTVGSIGIETGGFVIDGEAEHTGIRFSSTSLLPRDNGVDTDNAVNLGADGLRFKHLFISEGITNPTAGGQMTFDTAGAEAMRIDGSGNLLVSKTALSTSTVGVQALANGGLYATRSSGSALVLNRKTSTGTIATFMYDTATKGSISVTGSSTAYNTSSDYRLKENVVDLTGASARVNQLDVKRFNFIADDTNTLVDGFLAHEVADVVPEAITGTKDAMMDEEYEVTPAVEATYDEEGNELTAAVEAVMGTRSVPDYQGIDQSKLVPLLTAALQEALTEIASLKTRVEALEG